jgi:hypothetical protein
MQRFSTKAFILATVLHLGGTIGLIDASFRVLGEWKRTGIDLNPVWLTVGMWIWQPVSMFVLHYNRTHPHPPASALDALASGWGPSAYFFCFMLPWSVFVGFCFGFLVPRLSRSFSRRWK